jgi:hypothetical protein
MSNQKININYGNMWKTCLNLLIVRIRNKNKKNKDKRRIPTYLLANLLTLIIKELKISIEQGMVVTTLSLENTKYRILFSVVTTQDTCHM